MFILPLIKKASTVLKLGLIIVGVTVLSWLLWFPQIEGRNRNATQIEKYLNDPFLAYVYLGSVPFFIALYQAFKFLGYLQKNQEYSKPAVQSVRLIKWCAILTAGFILGAEAIIIFLVQGEDRAGAVSLGMLIFLFALLSAATNAYYEKRLRLGRTKA